MKIDHNNTQGLIHHLEATVSPMLANLRHHLVGRDVVHLAGYYKGRKGKIDAVTFQHNRVMILVYTYKKNHLGNYTSQFLNDRADSRRYWKFNQIQLLQPGR